MINILVTASVALLLAGPAFGAEGATSETPWSELVVRSALRPGPDGALYAISDAEGGSVLKLGPEGRTVDPIPASLKFRPDKLYYMSFDSEGGLWLFGGISQKVTAYFDGKEWHAYGPNKGQGLPYHDKEVAFQAQLGKGAEYRIGRPQDQYYVQYTADSRILYQNEWRRACYFDGKLWHAPYGADEVGSSTLSDHPFFHDGKVTIHVSGKCYQMENDAWSQTTDDRSGRPWKEVAMVPHPFPQRQNRAGGKVNIPAGCPIPKSKQIWTARHDGWVWVGDASRIACTPGSGWITIPTLGSPLAGATPVSKVLSSADGHWLFQIANSRPHKYVAYKAGLLTVERGAAGLGTVDRPFVPLEIPWKVSRPVEDLLQRYRIDDGDWSGLLPVGPIETGVIAAKGAHSIAIELFGKKALIRSPLLTYTFDVTYDARNLVEDLIVSLGARSFREREQATKALVRFGRRAIPQVKAAIDTPDPEVRTRLKRVLQAFEAVERESQPLVPGVIRR
jgi:hypothetical protein